MRPQALAMPSPPAPAHPHRPHSRPMRMHRPRRTPGPKRPCGLPRPVGTAPPATRHGRRPVSPIRKRHTCLPTRRDRVRAMERRQAARSRCPRQRPGPSHPPLLPPGIRHRDRPPATGRSGRPRTMAQPAGTPRRRRLPGLRTRTAFVPWHLPPTRHRAPHCLRRCIRTRQRKPNARCSTGSSASRRRPHMRLHPHSPCRHTPAAWLRSWLRLRHPASPRPSPHPLPPVASPTTWPRCGACLPPASAGRPRPATRCRAPRAMPAP